MKKKIDFVTNSSSVSYVGWGVYLSDQDVENDIFLKKMTSERGGLKPLFLFLYKILP